MNVVGAVDISGALAKLDLTDRAVRSAAARALNKTATTGRAQASREIKAQGYGMKVGDIRAAISIPVRANQGNLNTEIRARGKPIPLIQYSARQTRSGVSIQVKNGRTVLSHAFIAVMPSGHRGVFERVGKGHKRVERRGRNISTGLPIKELFGPSVKAAFGNPTVAGVITDTMRARYPIVLAQELNYEALKKL